MVETVYIVVGCDADPDREKFIQQRSGEPFSWTGLIDGIPMAREISAPIIDDVGKAPVISWCLRVDDQIRHYYDDYAWLLIKHKDLLNDLTENGDELSWHPHFWRLDDVSGKWYQEISDCTWQTEMLRDSLAAYRKVFTDAPKSVRMGWNYHNLATMSALSNLGIEVDFSAVPGLKLDPTTSRRDNIYDWSRSPRTPYSPSPRDYQVPGVGSEILAILEVPNLVSRSFWWGVVAGIVLGCKMKDLRPIVRGLLTPAYLINITAVERYFNPMLRQLERDIQNHPENVFFFNTYFHADEMAPNKSRIYSAENFATNLKNILAVIHRFGAKAIFIRACETAAICRRSRTGIASG